MSQEQLDRTETDSSEESAVLEIKEFLLSPLVRELWYRTAAISDVRAKSEHQNLGIDLVWHVAEEGRQGVITIQIVTDSNTSSHFYFEISSESEQEVPGAFLQSKANWCFYYFPKKSSLYCLPLVPAERWLRANRTSFKEYRSPSIEQEGMKSGLLVGIEQALRGIKGSWHFQHTGKGWRVQKGLY